MSYYSGCHFGCHFGLDRISKLENESLILKQIIIHGTPLVTLSSSFLEN